MWSAAVSQTILKILTFVLIMVNLSLAFDDNPKNTWSEVIRHWKDYLIIPYFYGVLGGHWFGLQEYSLFDKPYNYLALASTGAAVIILGYISRKYGMDVHPMLLVPLGLAAGYYLWHI